MSRGAAAVTRALGVRPTFLHIMRIFIPIASFCLAASLCSAQESRPASRPESRPPDPAEELIRDVDARLYLPEEQGLKSVAFSYEAPAVGVMTGLPKIRVHVAWKQGADATVRFVTADDEPILDDKLPDILRQPSAVEGQPTIRAQFEQGARGLLAIFRGQPYARQFRKWRKVLETREVNGREERTIVLEPVSGEYFRRVEMMLDRRSLPWKITTYLRSPPGAMIVEEPCFEEFDGRLVLGTFKKTHGTDIEQFVIHRQRVNGIIVPASYERIARVGAEESKIKTVFENVRVNE